MVDPVDAGSTPLPPIFIVDGHDVGIFGSTADAELQLEAPDVSSGIFQGFDALGRSLRIETDGRTTTIRLHQVPTAPSDLGAFKQELRAHLERVGEARAEELDCDLPCLVNLARKHTHQLSTQGFLRSLIQKFR